MIPSYRLFPRSLCVWALFSILMLAVVQQAFAQTSPIKKISTGGQQACALYSDGKVDCWDSYLPAVNALPARVPGLNVVSDIAVGTDHTCALEAGGTIKCWGRNSDGQLGTGDNEAKEQPTPVTPAVSGVVELIAGFRRTCALTSGGNIYCWGIGFGTPDQSFSPQLVTGLLSATGLAMNGNRLCFTLSGFAFCSLPGSPNVPVRIDGLTGITQIALSNDATCAVAQSGKVFCWGLNASGQLGTGDFNNRATPTEVVGVSNARSIAAGRDHLCASLVDGNAMCWGNNSDGQLGLADRANRSTATSITGRANLDKATQLSASFSHTCAIDGSGKAKCWGQGASGQVTRLVNDAIPDPLFESMYSYSGTTTHECARRVPGVLQCWGSNFYGALGRGDEQFSRVPVVPIGIGLSGPVSVAPDRTCAVIGTGVSCWGRRLDLLGVDREPRQVVGVGVARLVTTSELTSCATQVDGITQCWTGALGQGGGESSPAPIANLRWPVQIASTTYETCALEANGQVMCWGLPTQVNGNVNWPAAQPVTGLTEILSLQAGLGHFCAVDAGGAAWCWGAKVPAGAVQPRFTRQPVGIALARRIVELATKEATCLLDDLGAIYCFGEGLGARDKNGDPIAQATPTLFSSGLGSARNLIAGHKKFCADMVSSESGNATRCWGSDIRLVGSSEPQEPALRRRQFIAFAPPRHVSRGIVQPLNASASSGLLTEITSLTSEVCRVAANAVQAVSQGDCRLMAAQAGDNRFQVAESVVRSFTVTVASLQTVVFLPLADQVLSGNSSQLLIARSTSGLPITFTTRTPDVCIVAGETVRSTTIGECVLQASQQGNTQFDITKPVFQSFRIRSPSLILQAITFDAIADRSLSTGTVVARAVANSGLAVSVVSDTPNICSVNGSEVRLLAAGVCSLTATQSGNGIYVPAIAARSFTITEDRCEQIDARDCDQDGLSNKEERELGLNPLVKDNDVFANTDLGRKLFVMQLYRDVLNRAADAPGLAYWQSQLASGVTRPRLVEIFLFSNEATSAANLTAETVVRKLYLALLKREPDAAGLGYWAQVYRNTGSLVVLCESFVSSTEYRARFL